jgi:hypothetical protein
MGSTKERERKEICEKTTCQCMINGEHISSKFHKLIETDANAMSEQPLKPSIDQ